MAVWYSHPGRPRHGANTLEGLTGASSVWVSTPNPRTLPWLDQEDDTSGSVPGKGPGPRSGSGGLRNAAKTSLNFCKMLAHFRRDESTLGAHFSQDSWVSGAPGVRTPVSCALSETLIPKRQQRADTQNQSQAAAGPRYPWPWWHFMLV